MDLACGYTHTVVLSEDGRVFSWGLGEYGQLGRGVVYQVAFPLCAQDEVRFFAANAYVTRQPLPEPVEFARVLCPPDQIARVFCGAFHSIALSRDHVMVSCLCVVHSNVK